MKELNAGSSTKGINIFPGCGCSINLAPNCGGTINATTTCS